MKVIPFLLIVLVAIGAVYAWTVNKEGFATYGSYDQMLKARGKSIIDSEAVEVGGKARKEVKTYYPEDVRTTAANIDSYKEKALMAMGNPPSNQASGALPGAGLNTVPDTAPSMFQDPDTIKASTKDLQAAENAIGLFISQKVPQLEMRSDPTIQMPLSSLRADYSRLQGELAAMQRSPGLPSTLTMKDLEEIKGNFNYLNDRYNSMSDNKVHGMSTVGKDVPDTNLIQPSERATLADLKSARNRMMAERARLAGGGSLDPIINARISAIANMIEDLNEIIQRVESGQLLEIEIPVMKDELTMVFNSIGDTEQPIGNITTQSLPPEVANLLPPGAQDAESQAMIRGLADKYVADFMKGTSVELKLGAKLKYTSENEARAGGGGNIFANFFGPLVTKQDAQKAYNSMQGTSGNGFASDDEMLSTSASNQLMPATAASGLGLQGNASQNAFGGDVSDPYAYDPRDGFRKPTTASGFDWKTRAKTICENVRKMGMDPKDFGCLAEGAQVSPTFSWRGYARMICNRLQSNYYTGTDEACGCPPLNWPGWNSAAGEAAI